MKKRLLSLVLATVMLLALVPTTAFGAAIVDSGYCGADNEYDDDGNIVKSNLTWTLDSNGILIIDGEGEMASWEFFGDDRIREVIINSGITRIGEQSFQDCNNLSSIQVDKNNLEYSSINGVVYNKDITCLVLCPCGKVSLNDIPSTVTEIEREAFTCCNKLKTLTIPQSFVDKIYLTGTYDLGCITLFDGCGNLESIQVDARNTKYYSENGAVFDKEKSELVICPRGKAGSFTVPKGVNRILGCAFLGCQKITHVSIPDSVYSIQGYSENVVYDFPHCFRGCNKLKSIQVNPNNESYSTKEGVLFNKEQNELILCPAGKEGFYYIPKSVSEIGRYAFENCNQIRSIIIPHGVKKIKEYAFSGCSSIKAIEIPNSVEWLHSRTFELCDSYWGGSLTDIYYPGSEDQWKNIVFRTNILGEFGDDLNSEAKIHYNSTNPRKTVGYYITPMDFGDLTLNVSGTATSYYRVEDQGWAPVTGASLTYTLNGGQPQPAVTDGNGILAVKTPEIKDTTNYHVKITAPDGTPVIDGEQDFSVKVKKLSYSQEWRGSLGASVKGGLNAGASVSVAAAEAEASLLDASLSAGLTGSASITDEYNDADRTLTIKTSNKGEIGASLKSGIDGNALGNLKIDLVSAEGNVKAGLQREVGLKIEHYDPKDVSQQLQVGRFWVLSSIGATNSVALNQILGLIDNKVGNTMSNSVIATASGDAGFIKLKLKDAESEKYTSPGTLLGINGTWVQKWTTSYDATNQNLSLTRGFQSVSSAGVGTGTNIKLEGDGSNTLGLGKYILGGSVSNNKEVTIKSDASQNPTLSYKTYNGAEANIYWNKFSTDTYANVSFTGKSANLILDNDESWDQFSQGLNPLIDIQSAINTAKDINKNPTDYEGGNNFDMIGTIVETTKAKQGIDLPLPLGGGAGADLKLKVSLSGEHAYTYKNTTGVLYMGEIYGKTKSNVSLDQVKKEGQSLESIIIQPAKTVWGEVLNGLGSAINDVATGISKGYATLKGAVKGMASSWVASISTLAGKASLQSESYAIISLMDADEPDTNAAVSATIGDPYLIAVYTDDSRTTEVTDEELAENPLTLTLEYTDEMLDAAGADPDSDVLLFWFDRNRNLYVYQPDGVQDREAMTVTAPITKSGEYILAVDAAAPIITGFTQTNSTLTPSFTVLVSDLSGIDTFSFRVDDGPALVTEQNLSDYYDPSTGVFEYTFTAPLEEGEHTAYFQASDTLGNANNGPVSFDFAAYSMYETITGLNAPETVDTAEPFPVTVECSGDGEITDVALFCAADGTQFAGQPMTLTDGVWTADVTPITGAETMELTAVAADGNGNTTSYGPVKIKLELPQTPEFITISGEEFQQEGNSVFVTATVENVEGYSLSGILAFAAYQADGKMLGMTQQGVGLTSGEQRDVSVAFDLTSGKADYVKVFLLDAASGYAPQCKEAVIPAASVK